MYCPHCGVKNPETAALCASCSRPLPSSPSPPSPFGGLPGAAAAPARVLSHADPSPPPKTMHVLGGFGIALVVLLAALFAFAFRVPPLPNETQVEGYRLGRLLVVLGIPLLIAYLIAGRKKARNPNLFAGSFCGIGLCLILANVGANIGGSLDALQFETTDQLVSRLGREAAGLQPVRKSMLGGDKAETKLRDFFKQLIAINKGYQADLDHLNTSATATLNTPASFADPNTAAAGLRQLHAAYDLDTRQEQRIRELLEDLRRGAADFSGSARDSFLKGVDEGLAKAAPIRQRAVAAEKAWVAALDDVYANARAHHSQFRLLGGRLQIADGDALREFNRRVHILNQSHQEFLRAKSDLDRFQADSLRKTGLTRGDAGLR